MTPRTKTPNAIQTRCAAARSASRRAMRAGIANARYRRRARCANPRDRAEAVRPVLRPRLRRGARRARAPDSPLPDSARTPAPAGAGRQNRLPPHDSRGAAAWRRAGRSQLPRAPSASCRSRNPRRHLGFGPLRGAVDARVDGGRARMLPPRQQFRLRGPSGGGGLRAGPSGNDAARLTCTRARISAACSASFGRAEPDC